MRQRTLEITARARQGRFAAAHGASPPPSAAIADSPLPHPIREAYYRAMNGYIIRRYNGKIVLFLSGDRWRGLGSRWQAVAPGAAVRVIPGDHKPLFTKHVGVLAEQLSARLQNAQSK